MSEFKPVIPDQIDLSSIIPDSIEPYLGWKALRIRDDGRLESPQRDTIWPVKKRLEATCMGVNWSWQAIKTSTPNPAPLEVQLTTSTGITSTSTVVMPSAPAGSMRAPSVEQPKLLLPPGYQWSWERTPHEPAEQDCSCGVYAVADPRQCTGYISMDCLLAEVALWGKTVPARQGARGQYAYPQKLYIPQHLEDVGALVADLYGVPYEIRGGPGYGVLSPGRPTSVLSMPLTLPPQTSKQQENVQAISKAFGVPAKLVEPGRSKPKNEPEPSVVRSLIEVLVGATALATVLIVIALMVGAAALLGAIVASLLTVVMALYLQRN